VSQRDDRIGLAADEKEAPIMDGGFVVTHELID